MQYLILVVILCACIQRLQAAPMGNKDTDMIGMEDIERRGKVDTGRANAAGSAAANSDITHKPLPTYKPMCYESQRYELP